MQRITNNMLQARIDYLNKITNSPDKPWTRDENGRNKANIGNYHLSGAYGGVCVHRMVTDGGGVDTPICYGHVPKRELYEKLCSFISGYETANRS